MMKTIYLKSISKTTLVQDLRKACDNYDSETDFQKDNIAIHFIGDVELVSATFKEDLSIDIPAIMVGAYHANLLVDADFDTSIFVTKITTPNTPVHQFA